MIDLMKKTAELLKQKVKNNLQRIKENQAEIQIILRMPNSPIRTEKFNEHYNLNRELIAENNESINLQVSLLNYISRFEGSETTVPKYKKLNKDPLQIEDMEELFFQTATGQIQYNEQHPCFNDEAFYNRLMDYYLKHEEYERCHQISAQKDFKSLTNL